MDPNPHADAAPYTDEELGLRAALASRDGDTRDAATFFALTANRALIDAAAETLTKAADSLPPDAAVPLKRFAAEMLTNKR